MCACCLTPWPGSTTCRTPTGEQGRLGRGSAMVPVGLRLKFTLTHQPTLLSGKEGLLVLTGDMISIHYHSIHSIQYFEYHANKCIFSWFLSVLFISAASFSSLATGFRRTSSLDQRPDQTHTTNGPADTDTEPFTECPIHPSGAIDCPVHQPTAGQGSSECPLHAERADVSADCPAHPAETNSSSHCPIHTSGEASDCPMHSTGAPNGHSHHECPMHGEGTQPKPSSDCPLHTSGVQISISAPEPDPQEEEAETGNHRPGEHAGDTGSMTASRESLARYHGSDGGIGISSNNTLSHVPRTSIFKRPGRKRRHGDETFDHEISAFFPANLDFLALQEVFDHGATTRLRRQLHRYFPYVLSDVGRYGWKGCCSRFKFLNSGLMLASRYPILDARYECYPNGKGEDALAAKGALFAKVRNFTLPSLTPPLFVLTAPMHKFFDCPMLRSETSVTLT